MICYASSAGIQNLSAVDSNGVIRDRQPSVAPTRYLRVAPKASEKLPPLPAILARYQERRFFRVLAAVVLFVAVCTLPAGLRAQTISFVSAQKSLTTAATPYAMAIDGAGNLFVEEGNDRYASETVEIPADGSPAIVLAYGLAPLAMAVDAQDNLYVSDGNTNLLFKVAAGTHAISVVPTQGVYQPYGLAVDAAGDLYIVDDPNKRLVVMPPSLNSQTTVATFSSTPFGLTIDGAGNLYVGFNSQVIEVPTNGGSQQTIAVTGSFSGSSITADSAGDLFYINTSNETLTELTATTRQARIVANLSGTPYAVASSRSGNVFVSNAAAASILEVQTTAADFGNVNVCASGQTTPTPCSQTLTLTYNVTSSQDLSFSIFTDGSPTTDYSFAYGTTCGSAVSGSTCVADVTFTPTRPGLRAGAVQFTTGGNSLSTVFLRGVGLGPQVAFNSSSQTTVGSGLDYPTGLAIDGAGDLLIADSLNERTLFLPANGSSPVVLSSGGFPAGVAFDAAGNIFMADAAGSGVYELSDYSGGGQLSVSVKQPQGLATDANGNLYIADTGNNRIVMLPPGGTQQTILDTGLAGPEGIAMDAAGNLFIADTGNDRVVELSPDGVQTAVGTGLSAPSAVTVDAADDVLIADLGNHRVVEVTASGAQVQIGSGFSNPSGIVVDSNGNLFAADTAKTSIAKILRAQAPTLSFATTQIATTSTDSPQTVGVQNIGNQPLTLSDVSYPADFPVDFAENGSEDLCAGMDAVTPGQLCDLPINFTPLHLGTLSESLVLTDNSLNVTTATQSIALTGISSSQPVPAMLTAPVAGSTFTGSSVTFTWNAAANATGYYLWIGSTGVGSNNIYNSAQKTVTSYTFGAMPTNGETIYVRLITNFSGTWESKDYTFKALTLAALTSPVQGASFTGSSVTFTWSAAPAATSYYLWIGSTGVGSNNIYSSAPKTVTTYTFSPMPTNGETIYVRLITNFSGTWYSKDYTFKAEAPAAKMTAPTAGSTLASATVNFAWTTATGATSYYLWIGSTGAGSNNIYNSAPKTTTSYTFTQMPINGETIYVRLITNFNGTWVYNDYTYKAE